MTAKEIVTEKDVVAETKSVPEKDAVTERELAAFKTVKKYMWISMGAGLIPPRYTRGQAPLRSQKHRSG